ncbi:hypothetical protein COOONC_10439, partial [Cooperia oncophora]
MVGTLALPVQVVARSNNTSRSVAQEDKPDVNSVNTSEPEKSAQPSSSSSHLRRKLSKQLTVDVDEVDDNSATPIFVGSTDDDYFEHAPSSSFSQFYKPSLETTRRGSADNVKRNSEEVQPTDRPQSLPVTETPSS